MIEHIQTLGMMESFVLLKIYDPRLYFASKILFELEVIKN